MSSMTLQERLSALEKLGAYLQSEDEYLQAVIKRSSFHNGWFTVENQQLALDAIAKEMLESDKLRAWTTHYHLPANPLEQKRVGLVLAGNIPLVGFHDVLSVFVSGHTAVIKLSDKDPYLLPALLRQLKKIDARTENYFQVKEKLDGFDAVIATGSNNSARYFEAYFGKYPNIIRRNRNAVAVLTGAETKEELLALGEDVFRYFGLGCRNVSHLYVPRDYNFNSLLEALHEYRQLVTHTKYKNNFDYNYALFMLNKQPFEANGCIILTENESYQSHIAGLYYSRYEELEAVETALSNRKDELQLVVARENVLPNTRSFGFGQAQQPSLFDYADGVDTIAFLLTL